MGAPEWRTVFHHLWMIADTLMQIFSASIPQEA